MGRQLERWAAPAWVWLLAAGQASALLQEGEVPEPAQDPSASEPAQVSLPSEDLPPPSAYHDQAAVVRRLEGWIAARPELVQSVDLGTTAGDFALPAVQIGRPGELPLERRPTVLVLGGLDGLSLAGVEATLALGQALVNAPERAPAGVTFVLVPWASPEALAATYARGAGASLGLNPRAVDADGDGSEGEDGPDDLDADGRLLSLLVEDPEGPWVRSADPRFLAPAVPGSAPRYRLRPEGRDDDGDGLFNEDGPGGVRLDRNFPVGWDGRDPQAGPLPLSEPVTRALADLALGRRTVAVVLFQGNHGGWSVPGASGEEPLVRVTDQKAYGAARSLFEVASERGCELTFSRAAGPPRRGAAEDWFYASVGALAMEVAPWGAFLQGEGGGPLDALYQPVAKPDPDAPPVPPEVRGWARWLDDTRGGIGFLEWYPVELENGRNALLGGWEQRTFFNPPDDELPAALLGLDDFVLALGSEVPRLSIETRLERDGEVWHLSAWVSNAGLLPSGFLERGARLRLTVPDGARLVAGAAERELEPIPGRGRSAALEWIAIAPRNAVLRLELEWPLGPSLVREVRP